MEISLEQTVKTSQTGLTYVVFFSSNICELMQPPIKAALMEPASLYLKNCTGVEHSTFLHVTGKTCFVLKFVGRNIRLVDI